MVLLLVHTFIKYYLIRKHLFLVNPTAGWQIHDDKFKIPNMNQDVD